MLLSKKYSVRLLLTNVCMVLAMILCLTFELSGNSSSPENPVAQENPVGIYVDKLILPEGSDVINKCKYCGRFLKIGGIHKDAEKTVENQLREGFDERKIVYEWGKKNNRYLHVYIYRFEERRGGNFAVEKPAGVGFHMHLFEDNTIKRIFVFDEDQRPLLENIFNIGKFLRRGGKWITVDVLSQEGMEKGLDALSEDLK